jgi:hypothetical protein
MSVVFDSIWILGKKEKLLGNIENSW